MNHRPLFVAVLMAALAAPAGAQLRDGAWRLPQESGSTARRATSPAPRPVVIPVVPAQPVAFTFVPTIVMSDGTVFANFGFGFEPVLRRCQTLVSTTRVPVIAGNGLVLSSSRPGDLPPVPNQATPSQLQLQTSNRRNVSVAAQAACFTSTTSGQTVVVR